MAAKLTSTIKRYAWRASFTAIALVVGLCAGAAAQDVLAQLRGTSKSESPATAPIAPAADTATVVDRAAINADDVALYSEIFDLSEDAQWSRADALMKRVDNPILLGHVLAERYLSPRYRSTYSELSRWLATYRDHPQASKIHTLAVKRRHKGDPTPARPLQVNLKFARYEQESNVPDRGTITARRHVASIQRQVRLYLAREKPTKAQSFIESTKNLKALTALEADEARSWIANSYFLERVQDKAYGLAHAVAERNRGKLPLADWTAGLAAWQLGRVDDAAHHFEAVANSPKLSPWNRAAGGYWAARAHLVAGRPQQVSENLRIAAKEQTTFYGLLALRQLGQRPSFNWDLPEVSRDSYARALSVPSVKRAVALGQIGEIELADEEMRRGHALAPSDLDSALVSLSAEYQLPGAQLHVAETSDVAGLDGALYPIPPYRPTNGFKVDPALIYAFMRQESRFKPTAKSGVGAGGLMQIMPGTAVHITGDRSLRKKNRNKLYDPEYNLTLAQNYIQELLGTVQPKGNLFMLMVAYNGGPGNARKWSREMQLDNDPLLFIESIPARETRVYLKRVLANLWLYRYRMGEDVRSLDQVAEGTWPLYDKQDPRGTTLSGVTGTPGPTATLAPATY